MTGPDTAIRITGLDIGNYPINRMKDLSRLITAGKGVGQILLSDDPIIVTKKLGKPDFEDAAMGKSLMTWYANHDSTGFQTSIFSGRSMGGKDENRFYIKKIFITSPWFKTAEGLGVGSTQIEINKYYTLRPVQAYASNKEKIQIYTDTDKGISFEIEKMNKISIGVIVHKPHEDIGVYLNMREK